MADQSLPLPLPRKLMFGKNADQTTIETISKEVLDINKDDIHLSKLYPVYGVQYVPNPIEIYIDSYGGYVYQILGLISLVRSSKTPVHTIVTGCAMSCGYMLLINGHKRFAYPLSSILYHSVSTGVHGQIQTIKEDLAETKRLQDLLEEMTLEKTDITKKKLDSVRKRKIDWFIPAQEALELRIIDKIIK